MTRAFDPIKTYKNLMGCMFTHLRESPGGHCYPNCELAALAEKIYHENFVHGEPKKIIDFSIFVGHLIEIYHSQLIKLEKPEEVEDLVDAILDLPNLPIKNPHKH